MACAGSICSLVTNTIIPGFNFAAFHDLVGGTIHQRVLILPTEIYGKCPPLTLGSRRTKRLPSPSVLEHRYGVLRYRLNVAGSGWGIVCNRYVEHVGAKFEKEDEEFIIRIHKYVERVAFLEGFSLNNFCTCPYNASSCIQ